MSNGLAKSVMEGATKPGLTFGRYYTTLGVNPLDSVDWKTEDVRKTDINGKVIYELKDAEFPSSWSTLAKQIVAERYFKSAGMPETGAETSARQLIHRVSHTIRGEGEERGYFASAEDAKTFEAELNYLLVNQKAAFNSPVWFNVGLHREYGIKGPDSGNFRFNETTGRVNKTKGSYEFPQSSACFILSVEDSLDSLIELQNREVRLFSQGSGTGTNFSPVRSINEPLSGGGTSSGVISFLPGYNSWGGAIKSGGKTRRSAKILILNHTHPEIMEFAKYKQMGEKMAELLIAGGFEGGMGSVVSTYVPGQNANNSVRVNDEFMQGLGTDATFNTINIGNSEIRETIKNDDLMDVIAQATYDCGDPGLQFNDTINAMHTCPNTAPIEGSNPCSEFMFINDSACNLASLNLVEFDGEDGKFDVAAYQNAARVVFTAQEILTSFSSFPDRKVAENTHNYRPIGMGFANLGGLLMRRGIPYDSDEGREIAGSLTAILTGTAYAESARIARDATGAFEGFEKNREPMLEVIGKHTASVEDIQDSGDHTYLIDAARKIWKEAQELGKEYGFRNAQATVLAPTGTIGFMMDCDTTGIEPDIGIVKIKKFVGGGETEIINQSVGPSLERLGYPEEQRTEIMEFALKENTMYGAPHIKEEHLPVFDVAVFGGEGKGIISPNGHTGMVAAAQPFISGAISKTINLPGSATVKDIRDSYIQAWEKGVKSVSIYRDCSKVTQPLSSGKDAGGLEKQLLWGQRKRLPSQKEGIGFKAKIGGETIQLRFGEYGDGSLGEFYINMFTGGSPARANMDAFTMAASLALQHGCPPEKLVKNFAHIQAEPRGIVTGDKELQMVSSVFDFLGKKIDLHYLGDTRFATEPEKVDESTLRANQIAAIRDALSKTKTNGNGKKKNGKKRVTFIEGAPCIECSGTKYKQTGTCKTCVTCGEAGGCG
jgi:ribonucleoside-diphosphate reductase alpha chain